MASILRPNQMRYAQCFLPGDVESFVDRFLDEFYLDAREIDLYLEEFNRTQVPGIKAALQEQVDLRKQLIEGSPVPELSSLQAMQESLGLGNPDLDENDPELITLDERKLGAAKIVMLNGKMFALLSGEDLEAFRHLWLSVSGDYDAFIGLGVGIADSQAGEFTTIQYVEGDAKIPYINQTSQKIESFSKFRKISKYKQTVLWTDNINNSTSNYLKLKTIGFNDFQISQMFNGDQPRQDAQILKSFLETSVSALKSLTSLLLLKFSDARRLPRWQNEVSLLQTIIQNYLSYRKERNLSSYVFSIDFWERIKATLNAKDMKELFERRPEVTNMLLPTDENTLGDLLNEASKLPSGTSVINTYMLNLPKPKRDSIYEKQLLSIGYRIFDKLTKEQHPSALLMESLLIEVKGGPLLRTDVKIAKALNLNELKKVLDNPDGKDGTIVDSVQKSLKQSPDEEDAKDAFTASSEGDKILVDQGNIKPTNGLSTVETIMTIIFRRMNLAENFVSCDKVTTTSKSVTDEQVEAIVSIRTITTKAATGEQVTTEEKAKLNANAVDKFTRYGPAMNERIKMRNSTDSDSMNKALDALKSGEKDPDQLKGQPTRAKDRNQLRRNQGGDAGSTNFSKRFEYKCKPKFENAYFTHLENLQKKLSKEIIQVCEALKRAIFLVQDIVDQLIAKAQVILDQILGTLERLLTIDLNIGGAFGFESSLIKCSWSFDFGIKADLFGVLLTFLNRFFQDFAKGFRDGLRGIQDIIEKAICVPVRLLEAFLGSVNSLMNVIGCSLKDIKLPVEILDLLKAILFSFDLRSLILRKGYESYIDMTANFGKNKDRFKGLTQFASLCQKTTMKEALDVMDDLLLSTTSSSPNLTTTALEKGADSLLEAAATA